MMTRRKYLSTAALMASGSALLGRLGARTAAAEATTRADLDARETTRGRARASQGRYTPVITPNGTTLPYVVRDGVKEFHLTAGPVKAEFAPGMVVNCWGYNGQAPGPTLEAVEGDRVRILVTNTLPEHTSIHWHGILLPNGMDGVRRTPTSSRSGSTAPTSTIRTPTRWCRSRWG
jgi:FtsP/CotA-like multicopper oxidase with cupredoxin domain